MASRPPWQVREHRGVSGPASAALVTSPDDTTPVDRVPRHAQLAEQRGEVVAFSGGVAEEDDVDAMGAQLGQRAGDAGVEPLAVVDDAPEVHQERVEAPAQVPEAGEPLRHNPPTRAPASPMPVACRREPSATRAAAIPREEAGASVAPSTRRGGSPVVATPLRRSNHPLLRVGQEEAAPGALQRLEVCSEDVCFEFCPARDERLCLLSLRVKSGPDCRKKKGTRQPVPRPLQRQTCASD